jgi:pimeloyl-ACP methyl ester carboxylesterase
VLTDPAAQPTVLPGQFEIPLFLISGRRDHFTPTDLADAFLDTVSAPAKRHIIFEDSGHYPNEDEPERFISTVKELVGPYLD